MKPVVIEDVSEILEFFNIVEAKDLLERQLSLESITSSNSRDYFYLLMFNYHKVIDSEETTQDIKDEVENKFMEICNLFINIICEKFNMELDPVWRMDNEEALPGLVSALYSFFAKDLISNIHEVCISYIQKNKKEIFEVFEERKTKKDAATLVNKKGHSIETAVILANIFDVSTWILSQLSEEMFVNYLNPDYAPLKVVDGFFREGLLGGHFMEKINEMYTESLDIKSDVCFRILTSYQEKNE